MKRIVFIVIVLLTIQSTISQDMIRRRGRVGGATLITRFDAFNGTGALSGNWTTVGTFVQGSDSLTTSTTTSDVSARWTADTWSANQSSEVLYGITGTNGLQYAGPAVRMTAGTGSGNYYVLTSDGQNGSGHTYMQVVVNDVFTDITGGSCSSAPHVGDRLRLAISGTTLTAYINDVQVGTCTDATFSSGSPGLHFYRQNTSNAIYLCWWQGKEL